MYRIDLNCDLGEIDGDEGLALDAAILPYISSANVACGFHAGSETSIRQLAVLCGRLGISFGAHPGYADRLRFGRVVIPMSRQQIIELVAVQLDLAATIAESEGIPLTHVKPHGALYNLASVDADVAAAITMAIKLRCPDARLVGLAGSQLIAAGTESGLVTTSECFADRNYLADGSLVPRDQPGAVLQGTDEISRRAVAMIRTGRVIAMDGAARLIAAETICVHGDTVNSVEIVTALRKCLEENQIAVCRPG